MSEIEWLLSRSQTAKGTTRPDVRVARLAARHSGVVTTRQLEACGLDSDAITVRVRRGNLHPIHRAGIRVHRSRLDPRDVWTRDGFLVTSPARTILDLAATMPAKPLRRMVRQAQAEQRVNVRQLLEILHRHRAHRGAAKLRAVIADGPAPTRSAHEDLVLDLIDRAGIERPELNPKLRLDGRVIHPDMLWREQRLVIECDSRRWHSDPLTQQDDADKQAILEAHGHRVLRITWHQGVSCPQQTLARIRASRDPVAPLRRS
jgi:hypothetical protein